MRRGHAWTHRSVLSPFFFRGPHVNLERPRPLRLSVKKGKGVYDPLDTYKSVLPADRVRKTPEDLFSANGAIDDDMTDVDSIVGIFLRHRLREGPQARL